MVLIYIKVKANSSKKSIENFGNNRYLVYLKEPAENDRANIELLNTLAKYFTTPASRMRIKSGHHQENKIIEMC
ncbi:MAG: DUF167 domain-containing protein [Nanoarchaeota archaeon]